MLGLNLLYTNGFVLLQFYTCLGLRSGASTGHGFLYHLTLSSESLKHPGEAVKHDFL